MLIGLFDFYSRCIDGFHILLYYDIKNKTKLMKNSNFYTKPVFEKIENLS